MTSSGRSTRERSQEGGDLGGVVLAVGVEGDDRRRVVRERVPEAGAQGRAFARVRVLDEDGGARGLRLGGGVVGRAVVDDDDGQVQRRGRHDGRDAGTFLVAGDQREDRVHARTVPPRRPSATAARSVRRLLAQVGSVGRAVRPAEP